MLCYLVAHRHYQRFQSTLPFLMQQRATKVTFRDLSALAQNDTKFASVNAVL